MAKFDESKVINALHPEKAEIGKKYWYADSLAELKRNVVKDSIRIGEVVRFSQYSDFPFNVNDEEGYNENWELLYPYEEPPKQRMTNIQFMEWLSKRNGFYCVGEDIYNTFNCLKKDLNNEVNKFIKICTWGSEEWVEPTVDIYERDCKGGKE